MVNTDGRSYLSRDKMEQLTLYLLELRIKVKLKSQMNFTEDYCNKVQPEKTSQRSMEFLSSDWKFDGSSLYTCNCDRNLIFHQSSIEILEERTQELKLQLFNIL